MTFTLDTETVQRLNSAAERQMVPKSEIVRDAIAEFYERLGRLSDRERMGMLRTFDEVVPRIDRRSAEETDLELTEVREARRAGGRGTLMEQELPE